MTLQKIKYDSFIILKNLDRKWTKSKKETSFFFLERKVVLLGAAMMTLTFLRTKKMQLHKNVLFN